jgi:ketosteroid isomerase-like protein
MKTAKELMLAYLAGNAEQSAALFSENGTLELPYLASIGLAPVITGPTEIAKFLGFLHGQLYPGFSFTNAAVLIDTPDQVFAEYRIDHKSGISGKEVKQQFFGHLRAENGKIARLVEAIDVLVAAEAIFPNGLADVLKQRASA